MKKTLIAMAAVAVAGTALAQVTISGRADVGNTNVKTTVTNAGNRLITTANEAVGDDNLSTSFLKFTASEDLGGGMSAAFVHDIDIATDNGSTVVASGRDNTIGLTTGVGTIRLGRSYTPLFSVIGASDVFGTTGAGTVNVFGGSNNAVRASNAVFLTSPSFGGLVVSAMMQKNESTSVANGVVADTSTSGKSYSLVYSAGAFNVAYGYGKELGAGVTNSFNAAFGGTAAVQTAGLVAVADVDAYAKTSAISGSYDLGSAKVFVGRTTNTLSANGEDVGSTKITETNFGVSVPMGAVTLMAGAGKNNWTANGSTGSLTGTDTVVGATYSLSKRTTAYIKTGTYNSYSGTLAAVAASSKTARTNVGLRHTF